MFDDEGLLGFLVVFGGVVVVVVVGMWFVVWFCGVLLLWLFLVFFVLLFDGVFIVELFCDDLGFVEEDDVDDVLFVWLVVFLFDDIFFEGEEDLVEFDFFLMWLFFVLVFWVMFIFVIFFFDGFLFFCGFFGDVGCFWIDCGWYIGVVRVVFLVIIFCEVYFDVFSFSFGILWFLFDVEFLVVGMIKMVVVGLEIVWDDCGFFGWCFFFLLGDLIGIYVVGVGDIEFLGIIGENIFV